MRGTITARGPEPRLQASPRPNSGAALAALRRISSLVPRVGFGASAADSASSAPSRPPKAGRASRRRASDRTAVGCAQRSQEPCRLPSVT